MKKRILVIDDDKKLCELLSDYLVQYDYSVEYKTNPIDGLKVINNYEIDLIVLDVMLPEMNGFEVLKTLRKNNSTPVIMLTARGETMDKVVGLELGADDYLAKPYEPRELLARIQSILRRTNHSEENSIIKHKIICEKLCVDNSKRIATLDDNDLELTTLEYEILYLLIRNTSRVISRDDIMNEIRGIDWNAFNRSIDVAISRLRTKLNDDAKHPKYIKTIWRRGYQFIGTIDNNAD
ncbi:MAG: response regulator transcription factor [Gammaproteobacteria bacterium]